MSLTAGEKFNPFTLTVEHIEGIYESTAGATGFLVGWGSRHRDDVFRDKRQQQSQADNMVEGVR